MLWFPVGFTLVMNLSSSNSLSSPGPCLSTWHATCVPLNLLHRNPSRTTTVIEPALLAAMESWPGVVPHIFALLSKSSNPSWTLYSAFCWLRTTRERPLPPLWPLSASSSSQSCSSWLRTCLIFSIHPPTLPPSLDMYVASSSKGFQSHSTFPPCTPPRATLPPPPRHSVQLQGSVKLLTTQPNILLLLSLPCSSCTCGFLFFLFFLIVAQNLWISVPWSWLTGPLAMRMWSPNHWNAREFALGLFL